MIPPLSLSRERESIWSRDFRIRRAEGMNGTESRKLFISMARQRFAFDLSVCPFAFLMSLQSSIDVPKRIRVADG